MVHPFESHATNRTADKLIDANHMTNRQVKSAGILILALMSGLAFDAGFAAIAAARERRHPHTDVVLPVSPTLCEDMKARRVMNPGTPVGCDRLRLVIFSYIGFDGTMRNDGEVMVLDAVAENVLAIFAKLRALHFPIAKARLMNHYDGNDEASMADNNTSAFNVRNIVGGNAISLHAYGLAIDINPQQNPYAKRSGATLTFSPPAGTEYANRLDDRPWKPLRPGLAEAVIDVFANQGFFIWGGYWDDPIDYQHFQVSRKMAEQLSRATPAEARVVFLASVDRYRKCRKTPGHGGAAGRVKCLIRADTNHNVHD